MSTIPLSPTIDLPAPRVSPRIQDREYPPLVLPRVAPKPRVQPRKQTSVVSRLGAVLMKGVVIASITGGFYLVSSLVGTVALETASHDAQRSLLRSHAAATEESVLSRAVGQLRDDDNIDEWASYNGFLSGRQAPQK